MRRLVACPNCRRQYDAGELTPGAKFHCGCGKVLRVKQAQGHDAEVVRCSGCGAPREQGTTACEHCGSDFTLHERDLHTVCPGCLTRVSDRASYCHSCGKALTATTVVGEKSNLPCPHCDDRPHLYSRRLGREDFSVLECQICAGMWIESPVFQALTEKVEANERLDLGFIPPKAGGATIDVNASWSYRKCPECQALMQRRNYARRSGVIVDVCRNHGLWFDADELQQIVAWIKGGGRDRARDRAKEAQREAEIRRRIAAAGDTSAGSSYDGGWFTWQSNQRTGGTVLIDALIDSIFLS